MFPLISWPHCVLFPILNNSRYYRELCEHEKSACLWPGHVDLDPGCATNSWGLGHFGQPFCASDPVR